LCKRSLNSDSIQIFVPKHKVSEIIKYHHDNPLAGHLGIAKTIQHIKTNYYWPQMSNDIEQYCQTCDICQKHKGGTKLKAPLKPIKADYPFQIIGIDVTGPLTQTKFGNRYIIVAIDYYTKYCIAKATSNFTALTTARFIHEDIICKHGKMNRIHTDHGVNFESELIKQLLILLKIDKSHATTYHPICCGEVERENKTLKNILSCYVNDEHDDWDIFLQQAVWAYNSASHEAFENKLSPYEALFNRKPDNTIDATQLPTNKNDKSTYPQIIAKNKQIIDKGLEKSKIKQKNQYDEKLNAPWVFKVNDLVLLEVVRYKTGQTRKFVPKYEGPYRITSITETTHSLQHTVTGKTQRAHYNRLKRYNPRNSLQSPGECVEAIC